MNMNMNMKIKYRPMRTYYTVRVCVGPLEELLNSTLRKVWRRLKSLVKPRNPANQESRTPTDDLQCFATDLLNQMNRFFRDNRMVWFTVCRPLH